MKKLKNTLAVFAALMLATGFAGCSKTETQARSPFPGLQSEAQGEPAWKLTLKSLCAEAEANKCIAAHGFTILADGRYQVGPAANGQTLNGVLNPEEFAKIHDAIDAIVAAPRTEVENNEVCQETDASAGTNQDTIVLNIRGSEKNLFRKTSTQICFKGTLSNDAIAIHKAISELAQAHYPETFPNDCINSVQGTQAIYTQVGGGCTTDADCVYVDNVFGVIPNGDLQFVLTDNCTAVPPLVVANKAKLVDAQDRLVASKETARQTCGDQFYRGGCSLVSGFQANIAPPVCKFGSCRVSPAIYQ